MGIIAGVQFGSSPRIISHLLPISIYYQSIFITVPYVRHVPTEGSDRQKVPIIPTMLFITYSIVFTAYILLAKLGGAAGAVCLCTCPTTPIVLGVYNTNCGGSGYTKSFVEYVVVERGAYKVVEKICHLL